MKVRYILPAMLLTASCTPKELTAWQAWYAQDPVGATEFANQPEIQAQLTSQNSTEDSPPVAENSSLVNNHADRWDRIAYCESGGNWSYPIVTNRTGSYSGGLMIWTKAWSAYGGKQYAPNAYQATKAQQIDIAENILADQGWGAWDCA